MLGNTHVFMIFWNFLVSQEHPVVVLQKERIASAHAFCVTFFCFFFSPFASRSSRKAPIKWTQFLLSPSPESIFTDKNGYLYERCGALSNDTTSGTRIIHGIVLGIVSELNYRVVSSDALTSIWQIKKVHSLSADKVNVTW